MACKLLSKCHAIRDAEGLTLLLVPKALRDHFKDHEPYDGTKWLVHETVWVFGAELSGVLLSTFGYVVCTPQEIAEAIKKTWVANTPET